MLYDTIDTNMPPRTIAAQSDDVLVISHFWKTKKKNLWGKPAKRPTKHIYNQVVSLLSVSICNLYTIQA